MRRSERRNTTQGLSDTDRRRAEREFWATTTDPMEIERREARRDAIETTRRATQQHNTTIPQMTYTDEGTTHMTPPSGQPTNQMQEDLEAQMEQFSTPSATLYSDRSLPDVTSRQNTPNTRPNREQSEHSARSASANATRGEQSTLSTPGGVDTLSRGTISPDSQTSAVTGEFLDDNQGDVLRTSIQGRQNPHSNTQQDSNTHDSSPWLSMNWVLPDGTNTKVEEVVNKTIANFKSPGGGGDAMILLLDTLHPYFDTSSYLVDLDSGELFAQKRMVWHKTGLWCGRRHFNLQELDTQLQAASQAFRIQMTELAERGETHVMEDHNSTRFMDLPSTINDPQPPGIPTMDSPSKYPVPRDAMRPSLRRNYIKARQEAATIYILEYNATGHMKREGRYSPRILDERLQIVYGRVNRLRQTIDASLQEDDKHRRSRVMRALGTPTRFPDPQYMLTSPTPQWIDWINEENDDLDRELENEMRRPPDPTDPFNGTAGGIFTPLQYDQTTLREGNTTTQGNTTDTQQQSALPQRTTSRNLTQDESTTQNNTRRRLYQQDRTAAVSPLNRNENEGGRGATPQQGTHNTEYNQESQGNTEQQERSDGSATREVQQPNQNTDGIEGDQHNRENEDQTNNRGNETDENNPGNEANINDRNSEHTTNSRRNTQPVNPDLNNTGRRGREEQRVRYNIPSHNTTQARQGQPSWRGHSQDVRSQQIRTSRAPINQNRRGNPPPYPYLDETGDTLTCSRCGIRGHLIDFCTERVSCNWCHTTTHHTRVCWTYATFVRLNPLSSSRRPSPERTRGEVGPNTQQYQDTNTTQPLGNQHRRTLNPETQRQLEEAIRQNIQPPNIQNQQQPHRHNTLPNNNIGSIQPPNSQRETYGQTTMCQPSLETRLFQAAATETEQQPAREQNRVQQPTQTRPMLNGRNIAQHTNMPYRTMETQTDNEARPMVVNNYYTDYSGNNTLRRSELYEHSGRPTPRSQEQTETTERPTHRTTEQHEHSVRSAPAQRIEISQPQQPTRIGLGTPPIQNQPETHEKVEEKKDEKGTREYLMQLPDMKLPPPKIDKQETPGMVEAMTEIAKAIQQQITMNTAQSHFNTQQSTNMLQQLVNAQTKRDLDPALLAIPTFSNKEPEKCMDWIQRIRNVCQQSGRSLRQELINKSELLVQNFIQGLDPTLQDDKMIDKILEHFSDIQTPAQATLKLTSITQGQEESILAFNQKFKMLMERVDPIGVDNIRSALQINMYLGSIKPQIAKSIKSNRFYQNKHAPETLGEAMKKAEENYLKEIYTNGNMDIEIQEEGRGSRDVEVQNIDERDRGFRRNNYQNRYENQRFTNKRTDQYQENRGQLPRGTYTQIMVNPMQLDDQAFTVWMERLVEAKKRRQNNDPRPYRNFRRPYTEQHERSEGSEAARKPDLKKYIKPAPELNVEEIQRSFQCTYEDIEEACDLYNLDVEDCRTA